jgi:hypothetical protein
VKAGQCILNGPWTQDSATNVQRVIRATGVASSLTVDQMARALYAQQRFDGEALTATLLCFGVRRNPSLGPGVVQRTWEEVAAFIFDRYRDYRAAKRDHQQWPEVGMSLWQMASDCHWSKEVFCNEILGQIASAGA